MKTVTKKLFALLLVAVMLFSAVPFGAFAAGVAVAACDCPHEHGLDAVTGICADCGHEVTDGVCYEVETNTEKTGEPKSESESESESGAASGTGAAPLTLDAPSAQGLLDGKSGRTIKITMYNGITSETKNVTDTLYVGDEISAAYIKEKVDAAFGEGAEIRNAFVLSHSVEHDVMSKDGPYKIRLLSASTIEVEVFLNKGTAPADCTVELHVTQGKAILYVENITVKSGDSLNVKAAVEKKGYSQEIESMFVGSQDRTADVKDLVVTESVSVTVVLKDKMDPVTSECTVIFNPEGGYWTNAKKATRYEPLVLTVDSGSTVPAKKIPGANDIASDRKGTDFLYWKNRSTGEKFTSSTKITGNVELVPEWVSKRDTFTITFDPNGGSLRKHESTMTVHYKEVLDDMPVPSHKQLDFQGWFDENGKKWEDGDVFKVAHDVTLTAKWARSADVVLHIYMNGNTDKAVYNIDLDGYTVGDSVTMKHVQKDVWDAGISAKPGKKLEFDGLFDSDSWDRYVRRGHGGANSIEIERARKNDIYVMVFNGETSHRPWDPTNPKTGDQMMLEAAISVMALTAVGFVVLTTLRKKKVL